MKDINVFEKDFVMFPINEAFEIIIALHMALTYCSSHWFLAVICYPKLTAPEVQ